MYNLLIVDDEASVVDSLALTVAWEDIGIDVVHRAYSAEEAISIIEANSVDIVLTDIRMPEMDGFELIDYIRGFSKRIKYIILSGHDEFEYAKRAINYQALNYLLKPINYDELIETVQSSIQAIEEEWAEIASITRLKQTLNENLPFLRSKLLQDLIKNKKISENVFRERLSLLELSFSTGDPYVMLVMRLEEDFDEYSLQSLSLLEYAVTNIAQEVFQEMFELWYCATEEGYLVFLAKCKTEAASLSLVDSYAVKLQHNIQKYLKGSLSICLGNEARFPNDLADMYLTAVQAINKNVGNNKSMFITVDSIQESEHKSLINQLKMPPTISHLLESNSWNEALKKIHFLLFENTDYEIDPGELYMFLLYLSSNFFISLSANDIKLNAQLYDQFDLLLKKKGHLTKQRIYDWAEQFVEHYNEYSSNQLANTQQQVAQKIRSYINDHLSEGTSLQSISDHIGLHPVYLSKIYKSVFNETIGEYIYKTRIDRALYLLQHTDLKIADISQQLGFWAVPHFIKIFKDKFGITPKDFRTRLLSSSNTDFSD